MTITFRVKGARRWSTPDIALALARRFADTQEVMGPVDGRWNLGGANDYHLRDEDTGVYQFWLRHSLPRIVYATRVLLERWLHAEIIVVEPKVVFRDPLARNAGEIIAVVQGVLGLTTENQVDPRTWQLGDGSWTLHMTGEPGRTRETSFGLQASTPQSYHLLHAVGEMLEHRLGVRVTFDG